MHASLFPLHVLPIRRSLRSLPSLSLIQQTNSPQIQLQLYDKFPKRMGSVELIQYKDVDSVHCIQLKQTSASLQLV